MVVQEARIEINQVVIEMLRLAFPAPVAAPDDRL
jgi:hypothetical protein